MSRNGFGCLPCRYVSHPYVCAVIRCDFLVYSFTVRQFPLKQSLWLCMLSDLDFKTVVQSVICRVIKCLLRVCYFREFIDSRSTFFATFPTLLLYTYRSSIVGWFSSNALRFYISQGPFVSRTPFVVNLYM